MDSRMGPPAAADRVKIARDTQAAKAPPRTRVRSASARGVPTAHGAPHTIDRMTWETRELPVLRAIVEASDEGVEYVDPEEIMRRTGLDQQTVQRALWALAGEQPPYFTYIDLTGMGPKEMGPITSLSGHARRTVGTWPTPEAWADRLITALTKAADAEPDPVKKGKLRTAADAVGSLGGQVLGGVITSYVTHAAGVGC